MLHSKYTHPLPAWGGGGVRPDSSTSRPHFESCCSCTSLVYITDGL